MSHDKLPTDEQIRALMQNCDCTQIEALDILNVLSAVDGEPSNQRIIEGIIRAEIEMVKSAAIDAANTIDVRAGNAVAKALKDIEPI